MKMKHQKNKILGLLDFLNAPKVSVPRAENGQNTRVETDPAIDYIKPEALAPLIPRLRASLLP